jgi:hypothetical protein
MNEKLFVLFKAKPNEYFKIFIRKNIDLAAFVHSPGDEWWLQASGLPFPVGVK